MIQHKVYGNGSIRPSKQGVQKNVNSISPAMSVIKSEVSGSDIVSNRSTKPPKPIIQRDDELEKMSINLALNTIGLNKLSYMGMSIHQVNNYYGNFMRNRRENPSFKLAYDILVKLKKTQEDRDFQEKQINQINQTIQNNQNNKSNKNNNIIENNTLKIEKEMDNITINNENKKNKILTQIIPEKNIVGIENKKIDHKTNDILQINTIPKKSNNVILTQSNIITRETKNINVKDTVSVIDGVSYITPSSFILDKMKI